MYSMKKGAWVRGCYLFKEDIRYSNCSGTSSGLLPFSLLIHPRISICHHNKTEELDFLFLENNGRLRIRFDGGGGQMERPTREEEGRTDAEKH